MPSARDDTGVPRAFAAKRLDVSPHTVSMWVLRGYTARWIDEDTGEERVEKRQIRTVGWFRGARLYRWGDLVDAEMHTRNTRLSPRNPEHGTGRRSPTVDCPVGASA